MSLVYHMTQREKKHVVVAVDRNTRMIISDALSKMRAETIVKLISDEIRIRF